MVSASSCAARRLLDAEAVSGIWSTNTRVEDHDGCNNIEHAQFSIVQEVSNEGDANVDFEVKGVVARMRGVWVYAQARPAFR